MYQTQQSPISNSGRWYPFNTMNRSFMMDKKATFEEKYWVYNNQQQQWTSIELNMPIVDDEDTVVPPSLEEDPNQHSPLPPEVLAGDNAVPDSLDEFIKQAEQMQTGESIELPTTDEEKSVELQIIEDWLNQLTVKQLKEEYKERWWTRNVEYNNNKKNLINLILELVKDGTQQKETTATEWQDGSVD